MMGEENNDMFWIRIILTIMTICIVALCIWGFAERNCDEYCSSETFFKDLFLENPEMISLIILMIVILFLIHGSNNPILRRIRFGLIFLMTIYNIIRPFLN